MKPNSRSRESKQRIAVFLISNFALKSVSNKASLNEIRITKIIVIASDLFVTTLL